MGLLSNERAFFFPASGANLSLAAAPAVLAVSDAEAQQAEAAERDGAASGAGDVKNGAQAAQNDVKGRRTGGGDK
jgi:hypothetical protein